MDTEKLLRIYLNDHSAGAFLGIELAKRCLKNNEGTPLGTFLHHFIEEITEDRNELVKIMETFDFSIDRLKIAAAWTAERAGRLKLNGQLTSYSDLSRVFELEGLIMGVTGKKRLWCALKESPRAAAAGADLDQLIARANEQLLALEEHHATAARIAFS